MKLNKISPVWLFIAFLLLSAGKTTQTISEFPDPSVNGIITARGVPAITQAQPVPQTPVPASTPTAVPTLLPTPELANVPVTGGLPLPANPALAAFQDTLGMVYDSVAPSVVYIEVQADSSGTLLPRNHPFVPPGENQLVGSGFVWDDQGHIVTNHHVVAGAKTIHVTFSDGAIYSAELTGADPNSDLAVLEIKAPAEQLRPVLLGDTTQVKIGQLAIAIGSPFGLSGTMTEGIISGLSRSLPVESGGFPMTSSMRSNYTIPDIIQTDAALNPGNSGGVLVNAQGQVLGVTAAIQSPVDANVGIGFVIPTSILERVVPSLIKTGKYDHPWLGVSTDDLTPELAAAMRLKADQRGALVIDVHQTNPSPESTFRESSTRVVISGLPAYIGGDVITAVNDSPIRNTDDLNAFIFNFTEVGQQVNVTVIREGVKKTIQAMLEVLPSP